MIKRLKINDFKSFREVDLEFGRFNLFIGTNASGKSNLLEAFRVLQGIGLGDLGIDEVLNGKQRGTGNREWEGIRGGIQNVVFDPRNGSRPESQGFNFAVTIEGEKRRPLTYSAGIVTSTIQFCSESLKAENETLLFQPNFGLAGRKLLDLDKQWLCEYHGLEHHVPRHPHLHQLAKAVNPPPSRFPGLQEAWICAHNLADQQFLQPIPSNLRAYSRQIPVIRMGERGQNFAALVKVILDDDANRKAFVSWLQELTPEAIEDVDLVHTEDQELRFAIRENGSKRSAQILSDGTLKFAALAAAFFQPEMPSAIALEDIEDGIHPTRLRVVMNLLNSQSERTGTQIFATTHSPLAVDWARAFGDVRVFHFRRDEATGESKVRLLEASDFKEATLGELMSEGWLEATK